MEWLRAFFLRFTERDARFGADADEGSRGTARETEPPASQAAPAERTPAAETDARGTEPPVLSSVRLSWAAAAGVSLRGKSHVSLGMPLQDAHLCAALPGDALLLLAADGVGSEAHAEIGARVACSAAADSLRAGTDAPGEDSLKEAFACAFLALHREAEAMGVPVSTLSTTLHAAILTPTALFWGHAGDGGILALTCDGSLLALTEPMNGPDGESVIPLLAGSAFWQFGALDVPCQSVLLATDGVYNRLSPRALRQTGLSMDRAMALTFLSPYAWDWAGEGPAPVASAFARLFDGAEPSDYYPHAVLAYAQGNPEAAEDAQAYVLEHMFCSNRPLNALQSIYDDITVAVGQRLDTRPAARRMDDFEPPDYAAINRRAAEILYGAQGMPTSSGVKP